MNNNILELQKFRTEAYNLIGRAKDATFELMDAVLTTKTAYCWADFSLSPLKKCGSASTVIDIPLEVYLLTIDFT